MLELYLEHPLRLFVPVRVLLGLSIVAATALVGSGLGLATLDRLGMTLAGMAAFVLVCEHIVPAFIVRREPQRVLEIVLPSFDVIATPLRPLSRFLERRAGGEERQSAQEEAQPTARDHEAVRRDDGTDAMSEGEGRELLRSIVDFTDRLVREVMTPRPDIVAIRADATLEQLRAFFQEQEYSRVPVFRDSLDNILGFVFIKDLIKRQNQPDTQVTSLMRPAYFVPETKRVAELLREFQRKQVQSAVVVDEYGGTAGLVTLEDLLEEIVGEIRDEYDVESEPFVEEDENTFLISGRVNIDQVADRLGLQSEGQGFETFGGYLLTHLGRVPSVGETFDVDGLSVEVLDAEHRRIQKVRVRRKQPVEQAG